MITLKMFLFGVAILEFLFIIACIFYLFKEKTKMSEERVNCVEIIKEYLIKNGYSGLMDEDGECGCSLDELAPFDCIFDKCVPGYKCSTQCNKCSLEECVARDEREDGDFRSYAIFEKPLET